MRQLPRSETDIAEYKTMEDTVDKSNLQAMDLLIRYHEPQEESGRNAPGMVGLAEMADRCISASNEFSRLARNVVALRQVLNS